MKEVLSQGRQRMSEAAPAPPVNLPSRRRLMMQQLERHADHYAKNYQVQEVAVDHYVDNDHTLQQESAGDHDHQKLTNGSSLRAKYGLAIQNNMAYNATHLEKYTNDVPQAATVDHNDDDDHLQQQESAAADHYQKRGSTNVSALRAKYNALPNHSHSAYTDHHIDEYKAHYTDDHLLQQEIAAEHGSRITPSTLQAAQSHRAYNSHNHDQHLEHYTDDHHLLQQDFIVDHNQKKGSRIASSTLQAAQAQAAELRALHSAMLNNYGFADRSSGAYNNYHHKQKQEDALLPKSRSKKASNKKSKVYIDDDQVEEVQNALSSTSSASSTADCFICPAHEYPIFMPSHEDMLLSKVDGVNSMNRRSSVDNCEALMREERLNYIFDHDNKKSFSGTQYSDHSVRDNNISCLHESLNLPRRSASSLVHLHDKDDQLLHHMSLNLPQGSQHHLFNSTNYKQNPLFDHFNPSDKIASLRPMNAVGGSSDSSSVKRFNDNNLHNAAPNKPMKAQADDQYPYELKAAFTGRQRALLEFLSQEPARMRAFNELAAMETPESDKVLMQRSNPKDAAALPEVHLSSSRRIKGKYESTQNVDHLQGSSDYHVRHQNTRDPLFSTAPRVRQKLVHTLNLDHHDHSTNAAGISCDKCRPLAGAHTIVGSLSDSRDLGSDHPPTNPTNAEAAAPKEKPDQKKASIKGWFFRGKKKNNNVNLSNSQANPASIAPSKVQNPITSGASSATKEIQSSASTTSTAAATSHVFSSLINSEAEKELEVAMAMDLMELKVLQAKTKRDAAMAEALELRLAMDSMAKKLVEVERHCVALKTQLMDAQAMQHQDDQMLADHQNNASAVAGMISIADQINANSDDPDAPVTPKTEDTDHYESDSIDHREERRPAKGISTIRAGVSSGYGGRSSSRCVQPSKAEFLNAVAEARVGIKQVSRVLLQHIQECKGSGASLQAQADHQKASRGMEEDAAGGTGAGMKNDLMKKGLERENWGPILTMCREAARREKTGMIGMSFSSSRGRGVAYCVEALISMAFHEHFENVGFDKNGTHKILDPSQRALAFYHSFLKLAKLTPTQLLTQPSPLYNPAFDHFCSRKMRALGRAVGCPGRLWPDELARTFLSAARAVWLLHHLAFAYHSRPPGIFRVAAHSAFDARFMEVLPSDHRHVSPSSQLLVSLMVMPGFFLPDDIIKCKVLAS